MDLLQSIRVKFQQQLSKLQTIWWVEFNRVKAITWISKFSHHWSKQCRSSIQKVALAISFQGCTFPVKISPHRGNEGTTAGSSGDDGHHVVGTQNLNPVAVRVLNEGQATNFTCWRKTQGQRLTRIDLKIVRNTLSNHWVVLNRPHWSINKDLPSFGFLTNGTPCSSNSLQAA